jgi:hypothetical protein
MLYLYKPIVYFLNNNLLYTSHEYNKGPVIISKEYLYRPSRYKDIGYKYNKGPIITSSEYLYRPSSTTTLNILCI